MEMGTMARLERVQRKLETVTVSKDVTLTIYFYNIPEILRVSSK